MNGEYAERIPVQQCLQWGRGGGDASHIPRPHFTQRRHKLTYWQFLPLSLLSTFGVFRSFRFKISFFALSLFSFRFDRCKFRFKSVFSLCRFFLFALIDVCRFLLFSFVAFLPCRFHSEKRQKQVFVDLNLQKFSLFVALKRHEQRTLSHLYAVEAIDAFEAINLRGQICLL